MNDVVWDEKSHSFVDVKAKDVRPVWEADESVVACTSCFTEFTMFRRRHHCRYCGRIFCGNCSNYTISLPPNFGYTTPQRTCQTCYKTSKLYNQSNGVDMSNRKKFNEDILTAQNFIRKSNNLKFSTPLTDIGHRLSSQKTFGLIEDIKKTKSIISVLDFNTAESLGITSKFLKFIIGKVQHPHLLSTSSIDFIVDRNKAIIIRPFMEKGSLRDLIHKEQPKNPYSTKYISKGTSLSKLRIRLYGKQILEVLIFLKDMGVPYPHLHCGNIMLSIDEKELFISEIENTFLGFSPFYFLEKMKYVSPEVECFGNILYEMVFGEIKQTLNTTPVGEPIPLLPSCDFEIYSILESIFEPNINEDKITLESLLDNPLFSNSSNTENVEKPKWNSKVERLLKKLRDDTESLIDNIYYEKVEQNKQAMEELADNYNGISSTKRAQLKRTKSVPHNRVNSIKKSKQSPKETIDTDTSSNKVIKKEKSIPNIKPKTESIPPPLPPVVPPPVISSKPPPTSAGRGELLASIRQNNITKLKKTPNDTSSKTNSNSTSSVGMDLFSALNARMNQMNPK